jgi:hypothetical protein
VKLIFTGRRLYLFLPIVLIAWFVSWHLHASSTIFNPKTAQLITPVSLVSDTLHGLSVVTGLGQGTPVAPQELPASGAQAQFPSLAEFVGQVSDGESGLVRGIYAPGELALRIVQQPVGDATYIDTKEDTATQFQDASAYGAVGLLAHNLLAGRYFFGLKAGQALFLVYGDKSLKAYRVSAIADFQRLAPSDLRSDFVELATGKEMSASLVFARFYQTSGDLTLQTCIAGAGRAD